MSSSKWVAGAGGLIAALVMSPVVLMASVSSDQAAQQQMQPPPVTGGVGAGGPLKPGAIPQQYVAMINQAATTCPEESPSLLAAQLQQESGWDPNAVSPVGALGMAQFMPATWTLWGAGGDPFNPADAIAAQARLMCANFKDVNADMKAGKITHGTAVENALAAYNCGLKNVEKSSGFPTGIGETDGYVPSILALAGKLGVPAPAPGPLPPGAAGTPQGLAAVAAARKYLGYEYIWGAGDTTGPTGRMWSAGPPVGFDCEGLTRYATYQGYHIDIGAGTKGQISTPTLRTIVTRNAGDPEPLAQMQAGDVVLINFHPSPDGPWGHVVMYEGNGQFIHAPHTGTVVKEVPTTQMDSADWIVRRIP